MFAPKVAPTKDYLKTGEETPRFSMFEARRRLGKRFAIIALAVVLLGLENRAGAALLPRAVNDLPTEIAKQKPLHEVWDEDVPVMGHLAVALDGSVLVFKERRDEKFVEVKRSEDGGKTWGPPIVAGKRVKIGADMSDDGRYKGEHVGWSELANVIIDENTGNIMVFAGSLMPAQFLYRSRNHGKTWNTEKIIIRPDKNGWQSTTYCCDPGITLRHGRHKGRLLMPSQVFVGSVNNDGSRTYLNKGQNRKYFAKRSLTGVNCCFPTTFVHSFGSALRS